MSVPHIVSADTPLTEEDQVIPLCRTYKDDNGVSHVLTDFESHFHPLAPGQYCVSGGARILTADLAFALVGLGCTYIQRLWELLRLPREEFESFDCRARRMMNSGELCHFVVLPDNLLMFRRNKYQTPIYARREKVTDNCYSDYLHPNDPHPGNAEFRWLTICRRCGAGGDSFGCLESQRHIQELPLGCKCGFCSTCSPEWLSSSRETVREARLDVSEDSTDRAVDLQAEHEINPCRGESVDLHWMPTPEVSRPGYYHAPCWSDCSEYRHDPLDDSEDGDFVVRDDESLSFSEESEDPLWDSE